MKKIGLIGLGNMGRPIADAFLEKGYKLYIYDVVQSVLDDYQKKGAIIVSSPRKMGKSVDKILLILPAPKHVKEVLRGEEGILRDAQNGTIVVDMSTVDPYSTRENCQVAADKGVFFLDAPVLGRPQRCKHWTLPIGGNSEALSHIEDDLKVVASKILPVGNSGNGNTVKVLNNMMFGAINSITAEIMGLSEKVGLPKEKLFETIAESGAASISPLFKELCPKMINRDYSPNFSVEMMHKDASMALIMGEKAGMELLVTNSCQILNQRGIDEGLGKEDSSALVKIYK